MSKEITWDTGYGGGQSLGGLIDGFTEFMITYDFRKEERPFHARYGIEVVSGDGYYETLTDAKKACEDHWEEVTRPIPTYSDEDWSIDGDGYRINPN